MASPHPHAVATPSSIQLLNPPFSSSPDFRSTARLRILDSGVRISYLASSTFLGPPLPGFDYLEASPAWSFLIEGPHGRKVLFDLGVPKNWREAYPPGVVTMIDDFGWGLKFEDKGIQENLADAGVGLDEIEAVIWSHSHFDHIGDMTIFPSSVELVVGPGFKDHHTPGYPTNPKGDISEAAWKERAFREISERNFATSGLVVGELPAFDYFGDGSFYLLYTPGHKPEHLSALVRTTTGDGEDTFAFLGGDLCHHGSELRPSRYLHLPDGVESRLHPGSICPGSLFEPLLTSRGRSIDEPFFSPVEGLSSNVTQAKESIYKAQEADGKDNVLSIWAHAVEPLRFGELSPKFANEWKKKNWRKNMLWDFLGDFESLVK